MGVNLLGVLPLVQVLELTLNVGSCFLVRVGAWNRREEEEEEEEEEEGGREVKESGSRNVRESIEIVYLYCFEG